MLHEEFLQNMSFKNIIGHEKAIEILSGILSRKKIATTYLFCGESGIGKKIAALNFAKALNCLRTDDAVTSRGSDQEKGPCDECVSCVKIDGGTHPDFLMIAPEDRLIRIEEIRMIDDALSFRPFEGKKKVVIVDEADTMNSAAANAFLKTLEEPPPDSIIILVSSKPDRLPDTIRSRCSRINFAPLSYDACRRILDEKIPGESTDLIARLSMGRPGIALKRDILEERKWSFDLFESMLKAEKDGWTSREEMELWFEHGLTLLRDMAVLKIAGQTSFLINIDCEDYIRSVSNSVELNVIIYCYHELNNLKGLLFFNLNKSIAWNYTASLLRKELIRKNA